VQNVHKLKHTYPLFSQGGAKKSPRDSVSWIKYVERGANKPDGFAEATYPHNTAQVKKE